MTDRKFYKTIVRLEVLSEEPIPDGMTVTAICAEAIEGGYSARPLPWTVTEIGGRAAAQGLIRQGSDARFFRLTDGGNDVESDEL